MMAGRRNAVEDVRLPCQEAAVGELREVVDTGLQAAAALRRSHQDRIADGEIPGLERSAPDVPHGLPEGLNAREDLLLGVRWKTYGHQRGPEPTR